MTVSAPEATAAEPTVEHAESAPASEVEPAGSSDRDAPEDLGLPALRPRDFAFMVIGAVVALPLLLLDETASQIAALDGGITLLSMSAWVLAGIGAAGFVTARRRTNRALGVAFLIGALTFLVSVPLTNVGALQFTAVSGGVPVRLPSPVELRHALFVALYSASAGYSMRVAVALIRQCVRKAD